ncbi:magnesium transporter CorA family protein [Paenibacillus sp. NEAU-GSW1]|uniref:magnesium transporter CorA family protein n=1 Tax=Paenibacillus sp. NEAU-GSW1 TaxID=2682486 RepID=UPI001C12A91B|nr:magnesium transporter CorA family protein [Paenibacillus sp. NEAU-GSW1]
MMEKAKWKSDKDGGNSMIHRMLHYPAKWEWHVLQHERLQQVSAEGLPSRKLKKIMSNATDEMEDEDDQLEQMKRALPECASWLDDCYGRDTNQIQVAASADHGPLLQGTVLFQISEQHTDVLPFHFWLTEDKLVTLHDDLRLMIRFQSEAATARLESCSSAPEALFVMLGIALEPFHIGLDGFETRLGKLEGAMRNANRTGLMDVIFERRYDLLHWSHLFLPVRELHGAAKEAFMDALMESDSFKRMTHRLDRIETLLKHYALEIDTLISMDGAISSFRGNDIMKTLTIFTVMFTPASVLAALWGTNFHPLPWDDYWWGFTMLCSIVLVLTISIYIWLWRKGWTGDLLTGRRQASKKPARNDNHPISNIFNVEQDKPSLQLRSVQKAAEIDYIQQEQEPLPKRRSRTAR